MKPHAQNPRSSSRASKRLTYSASLERASTATLPPPYPACPLAHASCSNERSY